MSPLRIGDKEKGWIERMNNVVVRTIEYESDNQLYARLNELMEYRVETAVQKMRVVSLQVVENGKALAYLEPDRSVLQVRFLVDGEELRFMDSPSRYSFMTMEEVRMIDQNGELMICDKAYEVQSAVFCVDTAGIPFIDINLQ